MNDPPPPPSSSGVSTVLSSVAHFLKLPVLASSGLAVLGGGALYLKQNELIYARNIPFDARTNVPSPALFEAKDYEDLRIPTPDGESLAALLFRGRPSPKGGHSSPISEKTPEKRSPPSMAPITVLMFHGNAGNIGHRIPLALELRRLCNVNVLMLEYRGFGASTGVPDERGLRIDAVAGLDYIHSRSDLRDSHVVVYGQSLGGAVAIGLVAGMSGREKGDAPGRVAALVLENTFLSIRKLIPSLIPPARFVAWMCHQTWASETIMANVQVPCLFLGGLQDEMIPPEHLITLYDICRAPKTYRSFPHGMHNDTCMEPMYFEAIHDFLWQNVVDRD